MLNTISYSENAALPRATFGAGACSAGRAVAAPVVMGDVVHVRPRISRATTGTPGSIAPAVGQPRLGAQQSTGKQFLTTTRVFADSEGELGPHPAREPV